MTNEQVTVLGIVGSPRHKGNTDLLIDAALDGAREAGAAVEKVRLAELTIAPCDGCNGCVKSGRCVRDDDMSALVEKMAASQVWLLGTPVYWWGPTAQIKAFVDRWYGAYRQIDFAPHRVTLVVPLGDSDPRTAEHTVGMFQRAFAYLKMAPPEIVLAPGVNDRGEVLKHAELLDAARQAGRRAVSQR